MKNDKHMFQEGGAQQKPEVHYFVQVLFVQSVPPPMLQPKRKPQTSVDRLGHIAYHMFFKAIKQYVIQNHTVSIVYRYTYIAPDFFLLI